MNRITLLTLLVTVLIVPAATASISVGVGWSNHDWDRHHWHNRHWYGHRWPSYRWGRHWDDRWWPNDRWYRRYDDRPRREVKPAPKPLNVVTTTVSQQQVSRDSLASLPANARTELTDAGRIYRWQQRCYQLDNQDWRYHPIDCPQE